VLLSAAVAWEVAVKRSIGKLDAPGDFVERLLEGGVTPLPITLDHASRSGDLPVHHRDPFDRLLVAQALIEGAVLISRDSVMARYGVPVIW
jgi:PIN domain nuclease of toxin-antitoxin system